MGIVGLNNVFRFEKCQPLIVPSLPLASGSVPLEEVRRFAQLSRLLFSQPAGLFGSSGISVFSMTPLHASTAFGTVFSAILVFGLLPLSPSFGPIA